MGTTTAATSLVVHELFEQVVARTPRAIALSGDGYTLDYTELDRRANRLAHHLITLGAGRGVLVGLHMRRSADSVVAMLGVLKSGAAYVPLEPGMPAERLELMAQECGIELVVTGADTEWTATPAPTVRVTCAAVAARPTTPPRAGVRGTDLCYVPFTSGSTGRPKGTEVPHAAVPGFFRDEDYADWGPGAVAIHHSAASWDAHVLDLYPALLSGGRVAVYEGDAMDPVATARWSEAQGATVLWLTSAAFNTVVDVDPTLLSGLRQLIIGGEALSVAHVAAAQAALPRCRIVNGYGPSECTVFSTVRVVTPADLAGSAVPIGRAVGDRTLALLDEHGDPVPDGEVGELYVGGPAVARGYRGRPALTARSFVPDPALPGARRYRTGDHARRRPDGVLEFVGRIDGQVKIRGFRVEVDEVAAKLRAHGDVLDAAVAARPGPAGSTELVGYVVGHRTAAVNPDRIRGFVAERLPAAMVPSWIVQLDRLPLTRNGKLDRRALPDPVPAGSAVDSAPPAGPMEEFLATVWQELLRVSAVGRDQDFFQLGGQSLLATQLVSRIRQRVGVELPVRAVYDAPSLAGLAAAVDRAAVGGRSVTAGIVRVPRTRRRPITTAPTIRSTTTRGF